MRAIIIPVTGILIYMGHIKYLPTCSTTMSDGSIDERIIKFCGVVYCVDTHIYNPEEVGSVSCLVQTRMYDVQGLRSMGVT